MTGDVYVGLMSGTSLDGISAAAVRFSESGGRVEAELLGFTVQAYPGGRRDRLKRAMQGGTPGEYCRLHYDLGGWLADAAISVLAEAGVSRSSVRAIASHGQTVWHEPGHSTWQLGESAVIAERTGIDVIADFRARDIAAGGQGAPLVPVADTLLFSSPDEWRALQNIGGIGNVTLVAPGGDGSGSRAFDTGPGVVVIDGIVQRLVPGMSYDAEGRLAAAGQPVGAVVESALRAPYFTSPPPKSTGRELFDADYIDRFIADCRAARPGASTEDILASAVSLTARSIGEAYERFIAEPVAETIISGGGAKNPALVAAIREAVSPVRVRQFDELFFDGEAKEAVAFALLGYLHVTGQAGNVPRATGARGGRVLGKLTPGTRPGTAAAGAA